MLKNAHQSGTVSPEILSTPEAKFYRSWSPEPGRPRAEETSPIPARFVWRCQFAGFREIKRSTSIWSALPRRSELPWRPGACCKAGMTARMWLPLAWQGSLIRLVAESQSHSKYMCVGYLGVGTPFSISLLSCLKESVFVLLALHAAGVLLILLPGLAMIVLVKCLAPEIGTGTGLGNPRHIPGRIRRILPLLLWWQHGLHGLPADLGHIAGNRFASPRTIDGNCPPATSLRAAALAGGGAVVVLCARPACRRFRNGSLERELSLRPYDLVQR